jgi:hypothetical protein
MIILLMGYSMEYVRDRMHKNIMKLGYAKLNDLRINVSKRKGLDPNCTRWTAQGLAELKHYDIDLGYDVEFIAGALAVLDRANGDVVELC